MKRARFLAIAAMFCIVSAASVWAQDDSDASFTIAPPPLAYPEYGAPGSSQNKFTGTYVQVEAGDFELTGYGASYGVRTVGASSADGLGSGLGFAVGFYLLSGSGSGIDVSGFSGAVTLNFEQEVSHTETSNAIIFVGPSFSTAYVGGSGDGFDFDATTTLFGGQVGGQMTFGDAQTKISPWAMFQYMTGSTSVTVSSAFGTDTTDSDVSVSSTVFGFDVLLVNSGITLSGLLQNSGGDSDAKVTVLSFSKTWGSEDAAPAKSAARPRTAVDPAQRLALQ